MTQADRALCAGTHGHDPGAIHNSLEIAVVRLDQENQCVQEGTADLNTPLTESACPFHSGHILPADISGHCVQGSLIGQLGGLTIAKVQVDLCGVERIAQCQIGKSSVANIYGFFHGQQAFDLLFVKQQCIHSFFSFCFIILLPHWLCP